MRYTYSVLQTTVGSKLAVFTLCLSGSSLSICVSRASPSLSPRGDTQRGEREKRTHARTHVRTQAAHTPASREYFHTRRGEQHGAVSRPGVANHSFAHAVQRIYTCLCVCVYKLRRDVAAGGSFLSRLFVLFLFFLAGAIIAPRYRCACMCVCVCVCDAAGRLYTWGDCRERCSGRRAPRTCD